MPLESTTRRGRGSPLRWIVPVVVLAALVLWIVFAGRWLYVQAPEPSDTMVVLNGGTSARLDTAMDWLRQGEARHLIIDMDVTEVDWGTPAPVLARRWIAGLPAPESHEVSLCPSAALSTLAEARLDLACLGAAQRVLIVTSQYHTRRALEIFRRVDGHRHYSVAGAAEPRYFGLPWWRHREWAKTTILEWSKLIWWELVDRWRA